MQELKKELLGAERFTPEILSTIEKEKLWQIWVPKKFGGLEKSLSEGLFLLYKLAKLDGSLGWTVTLCSGANYFVGNLKDPIAAEIFKTDKNICFGGSGAVCGTAEKIGNDYRISGKWSYATGSYYLTHFTLNAKIMENGKVLKNNDGSEMIRSFVIPQEQVQIISDWRTMGLKATVTNSFKIKDKMVPGTHQFVYNKFYHPQAIFKIPFAVFADLTLWVNYTGMSAHFLKEAKKLGKEKFTGHIHKLLEDQQKNIMKISSEIEEKTNHDKEISENKIQQIHNIATKSVQRLSRELITIFPNLGITASTEGTTLNQIFRDYFTATQHHNFANR